MTAAPEGDRLRERALHAAAMAYGAAHGHPLEHVTGAGGVRWRTSTLAVVAGALLLTLLVGVVAVGALARPGAAPTPAPSVTPLADPAGGAPAGGDVDAPTGPDPGAGNPLLVVHVVGAVHTPGLVRLPPGSRVADAVDLAGGPTQEAELSGLNLARPVQDGEQVRVPHPGEELPEPAGGGTQVAADGASSTMPGSGQVDVNAATATELETLPGIGPVLAERIVSHRTQHGPFTSVDALTAVSGIGPRVLENLRDHVVVGG